MSAAIVRDDVDRGVDICLSFIREMGGGVSLVELTNILEHDGIDVRGNVAVTMPHDPNIVWWVGMSQTFVDILQALHATQAVDLTTTSLLTYMADGVIPNYPLASGSRKGGYKTVHWLPVTYCLRRPAVHT